MGLLKQVNINIVPEGLSTSPQLGKAFSVAEINAREFIITYPAEYAGYIFYAKLRQNTKIFATEVVDDKFRINLVGFEKGQVELQMEWQDPSGDITYQDNTIFKFALIDSIDLTYSSLLGKPVDIQLYEHINQKDIHEPFPDREGNENKVLRLNEDGETIEWVDPSVLGGSHTHDNKDLLDSLTNDGAGLTFLSDDGTYKVVPNQSVGHVHTNKSVLDKLIDSGDGTNVLTDAGTYVDIPSTHTHTNKALLDTLLDSGDGDKYLADDGVYKLITTISDGHSHTNKTALDKVKDNGAGNGYLADDGVYRPITVISDGHSHLNKSALDVITDAGNGLSVLANNGSYITKTSISDGHSHSNKATLDVLTSAGDGNSYLANNGTYKNITTISDGHTHTNKVTLDVIKNNGTVTEFLAGNGTYVNTSTISDGHTHDNKLALDSVTNTGDGSKFLASDGTYKYTPEKAIWGNITGTLSNQLDLQTALDGKASTSHDHNTLYYTKAQVDSSLATKSDTSHNHTGVYAPVSHTHTTVQDANTSTGVTAIKFWTGTQAEYDAIVTKDSATLYFIR